VMVVLVEKWRWTSLLAFTEGKDGGVHVGW
jgi:hypothetical protein